MGLDFGTHWDERGFQIAPVKRIVASGLPLPGHYGYPSFNYWVSTAALLPEMFQTWVGHGVIRDQLLQYADTHSYLLRLRTIFLVGSGLSVQSVSSFLTSTHGPIGTAYANPPAPSASAVREHCRRTDTLSAAVPMSNR